MLTELTIGGYKPCLETSLCEHEVKVMSTRRGTVACETCVKFVHCIYFVSMTGRWHGLKGSAL